MQPLTHSGGGGGESMQIRARKEHRREKGDEDFLDLQSIFTVRTAFDSLVDGDGVRDSKCEMRDANDEDFPRPRTVAVEQD